MAFVQLHLGYKVEKPEPIMCLRLCITREDVVVRDGFRQLDSAFVTLVGCKLCFGL